MGIKVLCHSLWLIEHEKRKKQCLLFGRVLIKFKELIMKADYVYSNKNNI